MASQSPPDLTQAIRACCNSFCNSENGNFSCSNRGAATPEFALSASSVEFSSAVLLDQGRASTGARIRRRRRGFSSNVHRRLSLSPTVLGFMALARIRRPEGLRHVPPGELGKVVGLDRVPEVRTLREKIALMADNGTPQKWMRELSRTWMEEDPQEAGYLYVDGHVRVYRPKRSRTSNRWKPIRSSCASGGAARQGKCLSPRFPKTNDRGNSRRWERC